MLLKIDFNEESWETLRCKYPAPLSSDEVDQEGEYLGYMIINRTKWAIVLWDREKDPDFCKADLLLLEQKSWKNLSEC